MTDFAARRAASSNSAIAAWTQHDFDATSDVINLAAEAYRGVIPRDCWHEPYMSRSELQTQIDENVQFLTYRADNRIVGVMGAQLVRDVTLIRHAYVRPGYQARGIGSALLRAIVGQATSPVLVGTWVAADWAIKFYQNQGFVLLDPALTAELLSRYWRIGTRQMETSVVLRREP